MDPARAKQLTVMDPQAWTVAEVYARALLGVCPSDEQAEQVAVELDQLLALLADFPQFQSLLTRSPLSEKNKRQLIARTFGGRVSRPVEGFLDVLARRGRLDLLAVAASQFRRLLDVREGKVEVTITTAVEIEPPQRQAIATELTAKLGHEVVLTTEVQESLLGGVVLRVGDRVFDNSIEHDLKKLQRQLLERPPVKLKTQD